MDPNNQTPVYQPDQATPPTNAQQNGSPQAYPNPNNYNQEQPNQKSPKEKKKKILFIEAGAFISLVLIGLTAAIFYSLGRTSVDAPEEPVVTSIEEDGPQPASSLDVQILNNSIDRTLSGLSNESDFPLDDLSDRSLGL